MSSMWVEVVSSEKKLVSVGATEVYARSVEGEIGFLAGHMPALLALDYGVLRIKTEDGEVAVAVHQGFLFFRDNRLKVLADRGELASDIDVERAEARLAEMQRRQESEGDSDLVVESLARQANRLAAAELA